MDIVTRLKAYMDHVDLQISQFADLAQIPRPTLSQILSGRNKKISHELLSKLHAAFPSLNINWLLFGDGEMDTMPAKNARLQSQPVANAPISQEHSERLPQEANTQSENQRKPAPQPAPEMDVSLLEFSVKSQDAEAEKERQASAQPKSAPAQPQLSLIPDATKKIQNIMVFYSDNSFEIFTPSSQQ